LRKTNAEARATRSGSAVVGREVARLAKEKNIVRVVFDRNGYIYHGRIKAVADGAREAGLEF
jgi:large subunit ribosomal protein L18